MIALILAIIGTAASSPYLQQVPNIGTSCSTGQVGYRIFVFNVNPYPITTQQVVNITMTGMLYAPTFLNEIWVSSTGQGYLNNQQVNIFQQYPAGNATFVFPYEVQYPAATWDAVFTLRDSNFRIQACWTFSYNSY